MSFTETELALGAQLFKACSLSDRPITEKTHLQVVKEVLRKDIAPTLTTSDLGLENDEEEAKKKAAIIKGDITIDGTTPLHVICSSYPAGASADEQSVVLDIMRELFQWGAGWMLLDEQGLTPGCIAWNRHKEIGLELYNEIVAAGTRSEVFLRRINKSDNIEFESDEEMEEGEDDEDEEMEDPEDVQKAIAEAVRQAKEAGLEVDVEVPLLVDGSGAPAAAAKNADEDTETPDDAKPAAAEVDLAGCPTSYLQDKLTYTDNALITTQNDGVMMDWEDEIMQKSADLLTSCPSDEKVGPVVLNVGFGMGIIDTHMQNLPAGQKPSKHYISEAHPDVLKKMRADGWFDKEGVVVLEGRWQDTLPELLSQGVYFDGMYYDTFSESYDDLVEFFDNVVGLLAPTGVFSFFNGLGADRQVCYDVYKNVVEVDLQEYGLTVKYDVIKVKENVKGEEGKVWDGIKRRYWVVDEFYLPVCKF